MKKSKTNKLTKTEKLKRLAERRRVSIEKAKAKLEKNKSERYEKIRLQYEALKQKKIAQITAYYERKLEKRLGKVQKMQKQMEVNKVKKIRKQEIKIKVVKDKSYRQKAFDSICYLSKIMRADRDGMVIQIDTGNRVHWSECVGGHIFPKGNYGHIATFLDNVWPISVYCNRKQLDSIGYNWWKKTPLSEDRLNALQELADNKILKNGLRDEMYWRNEYERLQIRIKEEEERLGIIQ